MRGGRNRILIIHMIRIARGSIISDHLYTEASTVPKGELHLQSLSSRLTWPQRFTWKTLLCNKCEDQDPIRRSSRSSASNIDLVMEVDDDMIIERSLGGLEVEAWACHEWLPQGLLSRVSRCRLDMRVRCPATQGSHRVAQRVMLPTPLVACDSLCCLCQLIIQYLYYYLLK